MAPVPMGVWPRLHHPAEMAGYRSAMASVESVCSCNFYMAWQVHALNICQHIYIKHPETHWDTLKSLKRQRWMESTGIKGCLGSFSPVWFLWGSMSHWRWSWPMIQYWIADGWRLRTFEIPMMTFRVWINTVVTHVMWFYVILCDSTAVMVTIMSCSAGFKMLAISNMLPCCQAKVPVKPACYTALRDRRWPDTTCSCS